MPAFAYEARNKAGLLVKGSIEANDANTVADQLVKEELIPIKINLAKTRRSSSVAAIHIFGRSIKSEELTMLCRQLASLMKAGVPITSAIQRLAEITTNTTLANTLELVSQKMALGLSLSKAMQYYPHIFSPLLIALVTTGEANGRLDQAFLQASKHYELANTSLKRIKTALRYPMLVMTVAFIAVMIINIFVIPKFAGLYANFHAQLPLPTRIIIHFAFFTRTYWWLIIIIVLVLLGLSTYLLRQPMCRLFVDRYQLKLPIFGDILERVVMANFSRSLSMLLQTGVPLIQSLTLVANILSNEYAKAKVLSIRGSIERGENLSQAAKASHFFSPLVLQMLLVGEETGGMDTMLAEVAYFYEQELDYDIKQLTDKIEPLLLIMIGIMVLILALGVFLPMWNMTYIVH